MIPCVHVFVFVCVCVCVCVCVSVNILQLMSLCEQVCCRLPESVWITLDPIQVVIEIIMDAGMSDSLDMSVCYHLHPVMPIALKMTADVVMAISTHNMHKILYLN